MGWLRKARKILEDAMTPFPRRLRLCSTCAFWTGTRKIKGGGLVEIHPYSKDECLGGGFDHASMAAMATCDKWQLWPFMAL